MNIFFYLWLQNHKDMKRRQNSEFCGKIFKNKICELIEYCRLIHVKKKLSSNKMKTKCCENKIDMWIQHRSDKDRYGQSVII